MSVRLLLVCFVFKASFSKRLPLNRIQTHIFLHIIKISHIFQEKSRKKNIIFLLENLMIYWCVAFLSPWSVHLFFHEAEETPHPPKGHLIQTNLYYHISVVPSLKSFSTFSIRCWKIFRLALYLLHLCEEPWTERLCNLIWCFSDSAS